MKLNRLNIIKQLYKTVFKIMGFSITLFLPFSIQAQKVWSLDDCINYSIENNLDIKQLQYDTRISKNNYKRSYADLGPYLGVNGGINHSYGRNFNNETQEFTNSDFESGFYNINANIDVFNGFRTLNSIRQNYFLYRSSLYNLESNKIDIILTVAEKYYNILYFQDMLNSAQEQYLTSQVQLERSEKMLSLGNASRVDYLNVKAQNISDKENIIRAENSLKLLRLDLSQLLNIDSTVDFIIQKVDEIDTLYSPDSIYQEALLHNPQLKASEFQLKSIEKSLSIARGRRSPQISASGSYSSSFNQASSNPRGETLFYPYNLQFKDKINQQIGLNISFPIYNKLSVQNNISNTKLSVYRSKIEVEKVKQILYNDIYKAHADAQAALEKYHTQTETVNALSEAFQIMQERFNMGLVNSIEFGISKNNLFVAQTEQALAKYEFILSVTLLELYSGNSKYSKN